MKMKFFLKVVQLCFKTNLVISFVIFCSVFLFGYSSSSDEIKNNKDQSDIINLCKKSLSAFPGSTDSKLLDSSCSQVTRLNSCVSQNDIPIFHVEKKGYLPNAKKILVFSLIHGDEAGAGTVGRYWFERLSDVNPRNTWRVVPVLNPDGVKLRTRTNANLVDLNRNFPTKDWGEQALSYWRTSTKSNPRRFPGTTPGSEPEVQCAIDHILDFKPDFIVSIHTPLNVLDFDGPRVNPPKYDYLPWKSLGHFPGSLGRFMWFERQTPVLTLELKPDLPDHLETFEKLQDVIGTLVKVEIPHSEEHSTPKANKTTKK